MLGEICFRLKKSQHSYNIYAVFKCRVTCWIILLFHKTFCLMHPHTFDWVSSCCLFLYARSSGLTVPKHTAKYCMKMLYEVLDHFTISQKLCLMHTNTVFFKLYMCEKLWDHSFNRLAKYCMTKILDTVLDGVTILAMKSSHIKSEAE